MDTKENREIRIVKTIHAPVGLVWKAWTESVHLIHWWGPKGFTSTIHTMDVIEGGEWTLTLHGPDGTGYPNRSVYKEIIPLNKIVFEHFNPHFITTIIFTSEKDTTTMDWTLCFDTAEMRETVAKAHNAEEGQRQNIEKLESYLAGLHG